MRRTVAKRLRNEAKKESPRNAAGLYEFKKANYKKAKSAPSHQPKIKVSRRQQRLSAQLKK